MFLVMIEVVKVGNTFLLVHQVQSLLDIAHDAGGSGYKRWEARVKGLAHSLSFVICACMLRGTEDVSGAESFMMLRISTQRSAHLRTSSLEALMR